MMKMNKPEWLLIIIGCFACLINGGVQPAFGVILSKLTAVSIFNNMHNNLFMYMNESLNI